MSKHWLITGVSSGLGRAIAEVALRRGDTVTGTVRNSLDASAFQVLAPRRAVARLMDVRDEAAVHAAVAAAEAETGPIDVLVNNAGYGLVAGVEEATLAEIRAQFEVNVFGAIAVLQAVLPYMRTRRAGRIVAISSVSGLVGWPCLGIYTGSKFAIEGIAETMAEEVAPLGIKTTIVEPGGFRTDFAGRSRIFGEHRLTDYATTVGANRDILDRHAGQEPGDPARAATAILAVVDSPAPPLRLLLGRDALDYATHKLTPQTAEMAAWSVLTQSTDFDT